MLRDARRVLRAAGFTPFALLAETQLARIVLEHRGDAEQALSLLEVCRRGDGGGHGHAGLVVLEVVVQVRVRRQSSRATSERGLDVLDEEGTRRSRR